MASISQYTTWKANAITYWDNEIDTAVDSNPDATEQMRTDLKADLRTKMDGFDTPISDYVNDTSLRGNFIDLLFSLSNYVAGRFLAQTPAAPVNALPSLPTDDVRDVFAYWLVDLPDYTTLFNVNISTDTTDPQNPVTTATLEEVDYQTAIDAISGYVSDDASRMESITFEVIAAVRERAAYLLFSGSEAVVVQNPGTIKDTLLTTMHVQEVLDQFGWTIVGLN